MSVADWVTGSIAILSLAWTTFTFIVGRRDARKGAREQVRSQQRNEIQRVLAAWLTTRLRDVTLQIDPDLPALKDSAKKWRESCGAALAILPDTSDAYQLITEMVNESSRFEAVVDRFVRISPYGTYVEEDNAEDSASYMVSDALSQLQTVTQAKVAELSTIRDPAVTD